MRNLSLRWILSLLFVACVTPDFVHAQATDTTTIGKQSKSDSATAAIRASSKTVPPAPVPPGSVAAGLSGKQVLGDDFTTYQSTADLRAKVSRNIAGGTGTSSLLYTDGVNASLAELDTTVQYNGHATVKYNQPGGIASTPELWAALPKGLTHLWIRAHIRFSPGYTTTGTLANSSNAYKLLGWGYAGVDGSGRLEITNTTQYDFYWGMNIKNTGTLAGGGNHSIGGNIGTEWTDGAWYTYIIEVDNTAKTAITRFYWGRANETPVLRATTPGTMVDGSDVPLVDYVNLGMNFNQVRTASQAQALWYGDWEVVDGSRYDNPFGLVR